MKKLLAVLFILSGVCLAQGSRYDSIAYGPRGPIANATIAVCTQPASTGTQPCTPLATLYTDSTLGTACNGSNGCSNPLTADQLGNFHFYGQTGQKYTVQIYGPQVSTPYVSADQSIPIDPTNAVFGQVNGIINAAQSSGSDIGAKINAAYAALPSTGGTIYVPAGAYSFSTPIVIGTASKFAELVCPSSASTTLTYTGTGTSVAVTWNPGNGGLPTGTGITGCKFAGPSSAGTTVGLVVGGSNGAVGARFENIQISGFGTGVQIASNTQHILFDHSVITDNGQNFFYPTGLTNAGEHIDFRNAEIANTTAVWSATCFQVASGAAGQPLINVTDSQIDQCGITLGSGSSTFTNLHMENPVNTSFGSTAFFTLTGGTATLIDPQIDSEQTNKPSFIIDNQGGTITIVGADLENTGTLITTAIHNTGASSVNYNIGFRCCASQFTNVSGGTNPTIEIGTNNAQLRGITTPDQLTSTIATGTSPFSITSTTPVANLTVSNHPQVYQAGTALTGGKIYTNSQALSTGAATHTFANSFTFASSSSYWCTVSDTTTAATVSWGRVSATQISLAGTGSDVISIICVGN